MSGDRWWRIAFRAAWFGGRAVAGVVVARRLAGAARRQPRVVAVASGDDMPSISVVVPARDETPRIAPLLSIVVGARGVDEVIVVDDRSSDATAELAGSMGATVVEGRPLPAGWAGKAWAMDQGLRAAASDWIVFLDADTRPDAELARALVGRALTEGLDLLTAAGRFECPTRPLAWLHPAMLTTLVYRYGPPGSVGPRAPSSLLANGQCVAVRRVALLDAGGMSPVARHTVEDVALARHLAGNGWRVAFLDARDLLTVRMYETAGDAWRGWGRSLALPGIESRRGQANGLAVVVATQVLPLLRFIARRNDPLDGLLIAMRIGTLLGTAGAYARRGPAYWASPTADVVAAAALARGIAARRQRWRGRVYPT